MEFTHEPLVKVCGQGVTSFEVARIHGILRIQINPLYNCRYLPQWAGVRVPLDIGGARLVHLLACVARPLNI